MNYLAHSLLAGGEIDFVLGGMAGDFVKGRLDGVSDPGLHRGLALHRRIDSFTDTHCVCRRARVRLPGDVRRYGGILTDMLFDHFLALRWSRYVPECSLRCFTKGIYASLNDEQSRLPLGFRDLLPRMTADDWLASYADFEYTTRAIDRVAGRVRGGEVLVGFLSQLGDVYEGLESDFHEFFPLLMDFAASERERIL